MDREESRNPDSGSGFSVKAVIGYAAMIGATVLAFVLIRRQGDHLVAPLPTAGTPTFDTARGVAQVHPLMHVLLALIVIIVVARGMGVLFARLRQPPVIGEVIAGILLGPSLLGRVAPSVSAFLLPPAIAPFLGVLAQIGVVVFMFLVGLELDTGLLRKRAHASVAVSHASIVVPFVLGGLLAIFLYPRLSTRDVPFFVFALFMGVSMSVTAFPVLARILTDRKMQQTRLGVIALACAAVDDVTAWCLLAVVVSIARARMGTAVVTIGLAAGFVAFMFLVVRPLVARLVPLHAKRGYLSQGLMAVVLGGLLLSALATEAIGIHALFGAFLFGSLIPHDSALARDISDKLTDFVVVLLLPAFFAFTGMRTQIGLVQGVGQWLICGLVVAVATLGKFGGTFVAARVTGMTWRDAASLGVLMNTRGLMELIVLNLGLDLRVISPTLFAMLVLMALATTFATTPILQWLRGSRDQEEQATRERTSPA